jgi:hypothetical protein
MESHLRDATIQVFGPLTIDVAKLMETSCGATTNFDRVERN